MPMTVSARALRNCMPIPLRCQCERHQPPDMEGPLVAEPPRRRSMKRRVGATVGRYWSVVHQGHFRASRKRIAFSRKNGGRIEVCPRHFMINIQGDECTTSSNGVVKRP